MIEYSKCPREIIGASMIQNINLFTFASQGLLPRSGGMLDQDAWFVDAWVHFQGDVQELEHEQRKRRQRE
jgi:hypothetical protein